MAEYDLLGILEGNHTRVPLPGLRLVAAEGLTAVLSADGRPLMRLPQSRKTQLVALADRLRHQEACLALGTFLPASPLAHLSPEAAALFLDANRPFLFDQIARFADLVQYQLQITWAEDRVLTRFRESPEIAPLFDQGGLRDPEEIPRAVGRLAARLSDQIAQSLASAIEILPLPLVPGLLWNGALLMPRRAEAELEEALLAIDSIWTEGFNLRLTGPAPVVSFCTLELEKVSAAQVDWALDRFGLTSLTEAGHVAAVRRRLLIALGTEAEQRDEIDFQARVIEAAARLDSPVRGFALARVRAEGQALVAPMAREVA